MNKKIYIATGIAFLVAIVLFFVAIDNVSATKPVDGEHKVWVCHATSGLGELKNGYNLIEVDIASTQGEAHLAHATTNPKQNARGFGLLYDYIDVDTNNLPGACGWNPNLPTTTTLTTSSSTVLQTTSTTPTTSVLSTTTVPAMTSLPSSTSVLPTTTLASITTTSSTVSPSSSSTLALTTVVQNDTTPSTFVVEQCCAPVPKDLPETGATTWVLSILGLIFVIVGFFLYKTGRYE